MRLERLNYNKIKIFLTSDDLYDRGLSKEDLWRDSLKWNQLFHDMLEEANEEFGVEIHGTIAVEIFSLHTQGMVMILTIEGSDAEESLDNVFIEMQMAIGGTEEILFEFTNIEEVIQLSKRFASMNVKGGSLYSMDGKYFLLFERIDAEEKNKLLSVLAEYGDPSLLSVYRLMEYGNKIIDNHAIETLVTFF
jgi:adapter protein MecA 1/2